jgi:hypothetical protein
MRGFLTKMIHRRLRRLAVGLAFGAAIVATTAVAASGYQDPSFGEAAIAVQRAHGLLSVSACATKDEMSAQACETQLKEVKELLMRVRQEIAAAARAANNWAHR